MNAQLFGPDGHSVIYDQEVEASFAKQKGKASAATALMGEIAPSWTDTLVSRDFNLPPENALQFDTSRLGLKDYRLMRDHYQINSSLSVLTFMLHQSDWTIVGGSQKARDHVNDNMEAIWTRLVRALSQAFWAGFSPCALQFENDEHDGDKVILTKIKDLNPVTCSVRWKQIKGASVPGDSKSAAQVYREGVGPEGYTKLGIGNKPGINIFDGIKQEGYPSIPASNSLWYPLLMEQGNMYGKKLLNAAYQPWFFSLMIHMFSNRYFERFGEPVMIGRAPYDDEVDIDGNKVPGNQLMNYFLNKVRNGARVTLPSDLQMDGTQNTNKYEYEMEYLESQMRGADFERYLTRLDEEMSLAMFTPLLLLRASEGGLNQGIGQTQVYQWQLNAILADWKEYIDKYVIAPMVRLNNLDEGKTDIPRIRFRKLGVQDNETIRTIVAELFRSGRLKIKNIEEFGQSIGLELEEQEVLAEAPPQIDPVTGKAVPAPAGGKPGDPGVDPRTGAPAKQQDTRTGRPDKPAQPKGNQKKVKIQAAMANRVADQFMSGKGLSDAGCRSLFNEWYREVVGANGANDSSTEYAQLVQDVESIFPDLKYCNNDVGTIVTMLDRHIGRSIDKIYHESAA